MNTLSEIDDPGAEQVLADLKLNPNSKIAHQAASALDSWREVQRQKGAGRNK